ncbi:hypothetical protein GJA_1514 [Janthinobacterium agaricidamnosum NBRC 102515 = DSM 9628]|uniref:Transmembrane protein n=1 Tax=Janthinobacterium agaricidamnosum NBRC 102515 = DSM 9628 TaxID=1349767 RepID=W0V2R1_9BURK|nr:hypothetical protein GJA_1514 [Janthinobacterium agaricidamnosum NBRC 102515 = DSM 9628]
MAYSLYKQTKVDWLTAHKAHHSGADPSPEQEKIFYAQNVLPVALQGYRDRAEMLAASFLETAIRAKINELALDISQSTLSTKFDLTHQGVATELKSLRQQIEAKRGVLGWLADAGASFLVNVLVIVFIGLIAIGYKNSATITSWVEKKSQVNTAQPTAPQKNEDHRQPDSLSQ